MTTNSVTVWLCVDCTQVLANGELGDDSVPETEPLGRIADTDEITLGMSSEEHACSEDTEECDCELQSFSWSQCDGCGSWLGGSRDAATLWFTVTDSAS